MPARIPTGIEIDGHSGESTVGESVYGISPNTRNSPVENGPFAGVAGVGSKGYPYFRNRCFVMARKGTDAAKVAELKELYDKILADDEMVEWLNDTMLLEVDTMTEDDVKAHIENVKSIVEQYKDIVAG